MKDELDIDAQRATAEAATPGERHWVPVAKWRSLDRECTGDGRPWPVGDRMADALSAQIGE